MNLLALIPHYNHPSTVGSVAHALRDFDLDVLIVDDGSREDCRPVLQNLQADGIRVLFRERNGGKGAAVKTGLQYAAEHGYTHVFASGCRRAAQPCRHAPIHRRRAKAA